MGKFKQVKSGQTGTYLDVAVVNFLHDFLNAIEEGKVAPQGAGKFVFGTKNMVLDLSPLTQTVDRLQQAVNSITQTTASGSGTGSSGSIPANVKNTINAIINSLNAVTISCNPGANTITIVIPNLPPLL
ncbi:MAG: hypothetical protein JSR30_00050 [Proteobacteria bacterium]|nr:hypothetical protein [Pseudomonadota bacterium]